MPAGKRASTYENPDYLKVASAFAEPTTSPIATADPENPGVQPRPAIGIQFVDIPEFPDLGTQVSQDVSSAIAGQMTVNEALDKGQELADDVAERYRRCRPGMSDGRTGPNGGAARRGRHGARPRLATGEHAAAARGA